MSVKYNTQNQVLLDNLLLFYNAKNLDKVINIINGKSKISLRLIDWFVTNYAKKNFIIYIITKNGEKKRFKVYQDYKLKLKAYSKKRFDPFCRWSRITIPYKNDTYIETTIGQLNFFRWYIQNDIYKYIKQNCKRIENYMNKRNTYKKNDKNTKKKRKELSICATKKIKKENVEITLQFL